MANKSQVFGVLFFLMFSVEILGATEKVKPLPIIQDIFSKAKSKTFKQDKKLQKKVSFYFDYDKMGTNILARYATKKNQTDVKWFKKTIKGIITRTVYPEAREFLSKVKISHEISEESKNSVQVLTLIKKRGEETEILSDFVKKQGKWRIINISIDDESWVENIQEQVHKTIKDKGWKELRKSLTKRLNELIKEDEG
jgi:ABC-type transporter MlaC component